MCRIAQFSVAFSPKIIQIKYLSGMKINDKEHSINYFETFITVAEDCKVSEGKIPPIKNGKKTIASRQYEMIAKYLYKYTSDDLLFFIFAERNDLPKDEYESARKKLFSKGQACFRTSPLTKQYGWGIHCNADGKMAIYGMESEKYQKLLKDEKINKVKAIWSSKT